MIPGKAYSPEAIAALLLRLRWLVVLPLLACSLVAAVVAWYLPSVWQSTAVISIVPQRIPESYVRATVTLGPQDRVESIRRDILSRPRLEEIIEEFKLYPSVRAGGMERVVARMRSDIKMVETKGDAFEVSFSAGDPVLAQKVAERLAGLFIDENIRQRAQLAQGSSDFLRAQLAQALGQLVTTEKRLETYRREHAGALPDQVTSNLAAISNTQMQLQQLRESINRDRDRRLVLERQVTDLEQPIADPTAPADASRISETASAAVQLQQAKAALAALERRLKPEHPDILRAKTAVERLTVAAREEDAAESTADNQGSLPAAEILRRRRIRDLRAEIAAIDRELAAKTIEESRLQGLAASYQGRVNAAPALESELTSLLRDYDTVSEQYRTLLANSKSAEMAQELERRQGGEQFRLLEAARVPESPSRPKRPLILAGGFATGLALGLALVGLVEFRDRTLRSKDDIPGIIGLPVLAAVPLMLTQRERDRLRLQSVALWALAAVLATGTAFATWGALHR